MPDAPPHDVTLPLNCAHCGGPITVQFTAWTAPLDGRGNPAAIQHQQAEWDCPYCQRENSGGFPGRLAWVTKRIEESDAKH